MRSLRRSVLPAILAVPMSGWAFDLLRGSSVRSLSGNMPAPGDWAVAAIFNLAGILLACLPLTAWLGRRNVGGWAKAALMTVGSAVVGWIIALALLIVVWLFGPTTEMTLALPIYAAKLGGTVAIVTALTWTALNLDLFRQELVHG